MLITTSVTTVRPKAHGITVNRTATRHGFPARHPGHPMGRGWSRPRGCIRQRPDGRELRQRHVSVPPVTAADESAQQRVLYVCYTHK